MLSSADIFLQLKKKARKMLLRWVFATLVWLPTSLDIAFQRLHKSFRWLSRDENVFSWTFLLKPILTLSLACLQSMSSEATCATLIVIIMSSSYMNIFILIFLIVIIIVIIATLARFVLYQLSKNLNRPFFFDFLVHLSQRWHWFISYYIKVLNNTDQEHSNKFAKE